MKYGYARVSSAIQIANGHSLDYQKRELEKAGAEKIYKDVYTGTKTNRPEFSGLIELLKDGDTLIVTKLDRFARSTLEGSKLIKELFERGVTVNILNLGVIENTPSGRLMFNMFMAFAEFERDLFMERTQEGKMIARESPDYKEGRPPKYKKSQIEHAMELKHDRNYSYAQVVEMTGISKSTLIRATREWKMNNLVVK